MNRHQRRTAERIGVTADFCYAPFVGMDDDAIALAAWARGCVEAADELRAIAAELAARRVALPLWLLLALDRLAHVAAVPRIRRRRRTDARRALRVVYASAGVGPCWHEVHPRPGGPSVIPP